MTRFWRQKADRARLERLVIDLVHEVEALRDRVVVLEESRSAAERLAEDVRWLGNRLDAELEKFSALARQVVLLDRKVEDGDKGAEKQRLNLVALAARVDWDMDSTRKSLELLLARTSSLSDTPSLLIY